MRICVVEDEGITLNVIVAVLRAVAEYQVEGFSDPKSAMARCDEVTFDVVLVDYRMGDMNGIDCVRLLRSTREYQHVPIVMLTADHDRELRLAAVSAGATDFLNKPFDPEELRVRVKNLASLRQAQLSLADRARHLDEEIKQATRKLVQREEELIWRLARAIEVRDGNTGEHISRVATVSAILARHLGMDEEFCRILYLASPLHDTGKIGIPDAILNKPGSLTEEERDIIKTHTDIGGRILENGDSELIKVAQEIALTHHEKWDGTGYGRGLAGDDIPISGRIVAVADVLDALCTDRPYKKGWSFEEARSEIHRQSGKHFDPDLVFALETARSEIEEIYTNTSSATSVA